MNSIIKFSNYNLLLIVTIIFNGAIFFLLCMQF